MGPATGGPGGNSGGDPNNGGGNNTGTEALTADDESRRKKKRLQESESERESKRSKNNLAYILNSGALGNEVSQSITQEYQKGTQETISNSNTSPKRSTI